MGGFQRYVDSAQVHQPDPISTYYVSEAERFDKDFAVADKQVREKYIDKNHSKWSNLRQERFHREQTRWDNMEKGDNQEEKRL